MNASPARVISESRGIYVLAFGEGETRLAELRGKFRHAAETAQDLPVTGDFVIATRSQGSERAMIEALLPRKSLLRRKAAGNTGEDQLLAANVDVALIVTSFNLDLNLRRIERTLSLVQNAGIKPVIVVTKADLADEVMQARLVEGLANVALALDVYSVNALNGDGVAELRAELPLGKTGVLIGSSGVGKSTLTNRLLGIETQTTFGIREADARGRHTTTVRQLFELPDAGCLIDSPGIREVALSADEAGIGEAFSEIERWMGSCRFTNCTHGNEPGCAIRAALARGELTPERLRSYQKLKREADFAARKTDQAHALEEKRRWKKISAQTAQHMRRKRWGEEG